MGVQKTSSKVGRTPVETRRSKSKTLKGEATPTPNSRSTGKKNQSFTHHLPTEEQKKSNGRVQGRSLIVWGRPRMAEKLLLHIQYECQRARIELPWNSIAHRLHPGSSGAAVAQHLNRLRRELIAEGHLVPPLPQSRGGTVDSSIRGYVRQDMTGDDKESTRPVSFSEKLDDRRYSLPDAFDLDMDNTPAMVTETREEDPFVDSPAFIKQSSSTFGGTPRPSMGPFASFDSSEDLGVDDHFLDDAVLSGTAHDGRNGKFFVSPQAGHPASSISGAHSIEPSTPGGLHTPITPVRSKSAPNMHYGYHFPYFSPFSYASPTGVSPAQGYSHGAFPYLPWGSLHPLTTAGPMDPSLQVGQAATPTSSPTEPLEGGHQEPVDSVGSSFDDILAIDDDNEEMFQNA